MPVTVKPLKIYNASAGSGKTYTLVQEYLRIVLHHPDPIKFRSILAMTFTNKAANEMKERIIAALIDLGTENHFKTKAQQEFLNATAKNLKLAGKTIEHRAHEILNKILHHYSSFSVMTIDKFTHKVIRTFAKDLGISIDFNVEMDVKGFRKNVTDMLIDQIGRNPKLTQLMLNYAKDNLQQDKSWNFSRDLFDFTDLLFKEDAISAVNLLKNLNDEDFSTIKTDIIKENAIIEAQLNRIAVEMYDLVQSKHLTADDFIGKSRGIYSYFKKYLAGDYKIPTEKLIEQMREGKWANSKSVNAGTVDMIGDLLARYFGQIIPLIQEKLPKVKLNQSILKNLNNLSLLKYLLELIDKVKTDENILLLSDFYKTIADIITKEPVPFIYERLGVRYQHFLLDEFQDTSQLQWINLIPLVHNALAQQHDNLIVGDGKQAIYRWRNGEVEQFTKLPETIHNPNQIASLKEAENLFKQMGERVNLDANYRSAHEVVSFNNAFFKTLGQKLDDKLSYIYNHHAQKTTKSFSGYVEAFLTPDQDNTDQLDFVLQSVKKAIAAGFNQKDICIITRVNRKGALIANYLTAKGYKIISPESLFIGKDKTVQFLYHLMQSISNPNDRNYKIKTIEHYCTLHDLSVSEFLIDQEDAYKEVGITTFFKSRCVEIKPHEQFHNLYDFVEHLIEIFDFDPTDNPYLQFYLESIHHFENNKNSNIRDYLYWFKEKGKEQSVISPEGADAINIMTIHKSKGLQFPVVICPFFDWTLKLHDQITWVEKPQDRLPAFFVNITKDLQDSSLKENYSLEKAKYDLDQYNLLYVAFTRPEIALFISGQTKRGIAKTDILPFFGQTDLFDLREDRYTYGRLAYPDHDISKPIPDNIKIKYVKQKMDKPELSYKSALEWDIDELDDKRNFGTLIHHILSHLDNEEQLVPLIKTMGIKQGLSSAEQKAAYKYIIPLFNNSRFKSYFTVPCWNEKEIVDANGIKYIPDKILRMDEDTLKVVDFKTGQPTPGHQKQIDTYIKVLKDLGYKNVSGEVFYTEGTETLELF